MSDAPTPRTDEVLAPLWLLNRPPNDEEFHQVTKLVCKLERELTAAREELETAQDWQSIKVSKGGETHPLGTLIGLLELEVKAVTEQRDRLAELLSQAYPFVKRWHGAMDSVKMPLIEKIEDYFRKPEALQSLNQNEERTPTQ